MKKLLKKLLLAFLTVATLTATARAQSEPDGSKAKPLRVMLVPADGGTEDGTKADFAPVFNAVSRMTGLHFDIKVGQSYAAVVEGMANRLAEIAFFGAVTYVQAKERGGAELLAVGVEKGQSIYYSGIFARTNLPFKQLTDLKGRRMAFGDVNSTSSFAFPVAMLLAAGLDPARDLGAVIMAGSHANSLRALQESQVEAAAASFESFEKALEQNAVKADDVRVLAKSEPIPYPPLAMHPKLPTSIKTKLKNAFNNVHQAGISKDLIRGYGGSKLDRYDADYPEAKMLEALTKLSKVTDELKGRMLKKAAER
jgi:phosphonate transport system substrate-binding protein